MTKRRDCATTEFDDEFDQKRRSDRVLEEEGLEKKKRECSLSFDRRPSISNQGKTSGTTISVTTLKRRR